MPKIPRRIRIIRSAIDRGINFLDNCWDYHAGESERRMGRSSPRRLSRPGVSDDEIRWAHQEIDRRVRSTSRSSGSQTDHVDLIQYHENIRLEDPDRFFAPDGPLEALLEAKKAGKIRFIGFTGHKDPTVHLRMLELAAAA